MRYEGSPVKALPFPRRRMTPPTPKQNSYASFWRVAGKLRRGRQRMECERKNNHRKNERVSGKSYSVKVRVEELRELVGF